MRTSTFLESVAAVEQIRRAFMAFREIGDWWDGEDGLRERESDDRDHGVWRLI